MSQPRFLLLPLVFSTLALGSIQAQSPTPILLQPVAPGALAPKPVPAANPMEDAAKLQDMMQLLQAMRATNADTLKKQEAALATLEALEKAADDIKTFSKRG
jgi:hypothetical protein